MRGEPQGVHRNHATSRFVSLHHCIGGWMPRGLHSKTRVPADFRFQGIADIAGISAQPAQSQLTQCMVRPCVARRLRRIGGGGLASMYPASEWSICSGPSWISARVGSHYRTGLDRGHLGHQCSHALGRPILHLVLFSRRPRLETVDRVTSSLAPDIAQFLCSSQGPFLRPGPQNVDRVARRGGQGRPSRWACGGLRRCQAAP